MKRPSDPSPPEYSGPSILDIIPKDVLTSLILRDWGNFSIADLLRFCSASNESMKQCNDTWTQLFLKRVKELPFKDYALSNLVNPFARFIAYETYLAFSKSIGGFSLQYKGATFILFRHFPEKSDFECIFWNMEKNDYMKLLKATKMRYSKNTSFSFTIFYQTEFDLLQIFYNWIELDAKSRTVYQAPFHHCITCGNPATLQELGNNNRIFCSKACQTDQ
jgi:hypothetical protein